MSPNSTDRLSYEQLLQALHEYCKLAGSPYTPTHSSAGLLSHFVWLIMNAISTEDIERLLHIIPKRYQLDNAGVTKLKALYKQFWNGEKGGSPIDETAAKHMIYLFGDGIGQPIHPLNELIASYYVGLPEQRFDFECWEAVKTRGEESKTSPLTYLGFNQEDPGTELQLWISPDGQTIRLVLRSQPTSPREASNEVAYIRDAVLKLHSAEEHGIKFFVREVPLAKFTPAEYLITGGDTPLFPSMFLNEKQDSPMDPLYQTAHTALSEWALSLAQQ